MIKNKLVLKVELYNTNSIKLSIVFIDKSILTQNNKLRSYFFKVSKDESFYIYSKDTFLILYDSLRLPDINNYKPNVNFIKTFKNNSDRYNYLKKLHFSLNNWNIHSDNEQCQNNKRSVKFNGEFWIL